MLPEEFIARLEKGKYFKFFEGVSRLEYPNNIEIEYVELGAAHKLQLSDAGLDIDDH